MYLARLTGGEYAVTALLIIPVGQGSDRSEIDASVPIIGRYHSRIRSELGYEHTIPSSQLTSRIVTLERSSEVLYPMEGRVVAVVIIVCAVHRGSRLVYYIVADDLKADIPEAEH